MVMYVPQMPELDDLEYRILRAVQSGGFISGSELMRELGLKEDEFIVPINKLVKMDLVLAAGDISDEKEIRYAMFSTRPSASSFVEQTLKYKA